jgi:hypothetical protein
MLCCHVPIVIPIQLMIATNPLVETLQCNVSTLHGLSVAFFFQIGIGIGFPCATTGCSHIDTLILLTVHLLSI